MGADSEHIFEGAFIHDALFYRDVESQFSTASLFAWHVQENKSQDETKELVQLMAGKERGPQMRAIAQRLRTLIRADLRRHQEMRCKKRKGEKW